MKFYFQGDVCLEAVDDVPITGAMIEPDPDGAVVLARGETTGHRHAFYGGAMLFRDDALARDMPAPELYIGHVKLEVPTELVHGTTNGGGRRRPRGGRASGRHLSGAWPASARSLGRARRLAVRDGLGLTIMGAGGGDVMPSIFMFGLLALIPAGLLMAWFDEEIKKRKAEDPDWTAQKGLMRSGERTLRALDEKGGFR